MSDYHKGESLLEAGRFEEAKSALARAIRRTHHDLLHPHILLCKIYAREGSFDLALKKRAEIDLAITRAEPAVSASTREYVSYYTYSLFPMELIASHVDELRLPQVGQIKLGEVSGTIRRNFRMVLPERSSSRPHD